MKHFTKILYILAFILFIAFQAACVSNAKKAKFLPQDTVVNETHEEQQNNSHEKTEDKPQINNENSDNATEQDNNSNVENNENNTNEPFADVDDDQNNETGNEQSTSDSNISICDILVIAGSEETYYENCSEYFSSEINTDCSIILIKNISVDAISISANVELDLNGHDIEIVTGINIINGTNLTIKDDGNNGKISATSFVLDGNISIFGGKIDFSVEINAGSIKVYGGMFHQSIYLDYAEFLASGHYFNMQPIDIDGVAYYLVL